MPNVHCHPRAAGGAPPTVSPNAAITAAWATRPVDPAVPAPVLHCPVAVLAAVWMMYPPMVRPACPVLHHSLCPPSSAVGELVDGTIRPNITTRLLSSVGVISDAVCTVLRTLDAPAPVTPSGVPVDTPRHCPTASAPVQDRSKSRLMRVDSELTALRSEEH